MDKKAPVIRFKGFGDDWEQRKLIDVLDVMDGDRGKNYPSSNDFYDDGHTLFLSASNVTKQGFQFTDNQFITENKSNSMGNGKIILNDIILTSRGSIGNIALYDSNIKKLFSNVRINSGMLILRSHSQNSPLFITQLLKSPIGKKQIDFISFGSAQPQITKKDINNFPINLPSKEEQIKIGNFFTIFDDTIALHQRKLETFRQLKKGFLQKLFPKNQENVPEIRFTNFQEEWEQRNFFDNIQDIIDFRGRTPKKLGMDWSNSGYLALSALNVKNGYIDSSADAHYGSEELYEIWMGNRELREGQVLFTTEAPMGNVAQVPDNKGYILSQRTIAFNVNNEKITDVFLAVLLRSPNVFNDLSALSSGGTAKGVSQKSLSGLKVVVPTDLREQERTGLFFKQLDETLALHQSKLEQLKLLKSGLLQKMFI